MTEPCVQGERLVTLETILEQVSETLHEQKTLGIKTYEVLANISKQGEQIKSLMVRVSRVEHDLEAGFVRTRKIEEMLIVHESFIANHREAADRANKISAPLIAGLVIAAIVAVCVFGINMLDRHNYTQPPAVKEVK